MIKAVIFDIGGVLIENPASKMKKFISNALNISERALVYRSSPYIADFQKGLISENELLKRVTKNTWNQQEYGDSIWKRAIEESYSPIKEMFYLITMLKKCDLKIGILSNTEIPVVEFLQNQDFSMFDEIIYSCLEGLRKPEEEIYLLSINRIGFEADEIIFVDDREENVIAARQIGIIGIQFLSPDQVKKDIESIIGLDLGEEE
ncbi:MAG: HAD family hydrolase [Candidatus Hodarchaeales archaeon]